MFERSVIGRSDGCIVTSKMGEHTTVFVSKVRGIQSSPSAGVPVGVPKQGGQVLSRTQTLLSQDLLRGMGHRMGAVTHQENVNGCSKVPISIWQYHQTLTYQENL